MKNLAVIPARSGSKTLPDKNIKCLLGTPLIAYSIKPAIESKLFSKVIVSTDSEKYASIAKKYGAEVPFLRSDKMASDTAGSWDAVKEVLEQYDYLGDKFDTICLLQPTSPLRETIDIVNAYSLFIEKQADSIIGVCEADHSPLWMNTIPANLSMEDFISEGIRNKNRQSLDAYYRINGAMYIRKTSSVLKDESVYNNSFAYVMPREKSVDIDTELDFILAETIMRMRSGEGE